MKTTILFCLAICTFTAGALPAFNSIRSALDMEKNFQAMLANPQPDLAIQTRLIDQLLTSLYRTQAFINDFDKDLDRMQSQSKANPQFKPAPVESKAYQNIQSQEAVSDQLQTHLIYIYQRLLQTKKDPQASAEMRLKCEQTLAQIDSYFAHLPPEDQLQLAEVTKALANVRAEEGQVSDQTQTPAEQSEPAPAVQAAIDQKARTAKQAADPLLDQLFREQQQELENVSGPLTPLRASIGRDGNVDGRQFQDGQWVLTFDDGPDRRYSPVLMQSLMNHRDKVNPNGAPASFFWLAGKIAKNGDLIREAIKDGFSLNCHSWTHANLARQSHAVREHEVIDAVEAERKAFNRDFHFFRCPYGSCIRVPEVRQMIASEGLIHAFWSVDSLDWKLKNAKRTFDLVKKQMLLQKHGIVLMHDIHPYSVAAAKMVLDWIAQQNNSGQSHIELYTIDRAVEIYNREVLTRISQAGR